MAQESQHDEVGVQTVQAVSSVGIVLWLRSGPSDVLHYFVLSLSRYIVTGKDHLAFLPARVFANLLVYEILELFRELGHEHGTYQNQTLRRTMEGRANTGGDAVAIERLPSWKFPSFSLSPPSDFSRLLG